jgi:hypothetical protein
MEDKQSHIPSSDGRCRLQRDHPAMDRDGPAPEKLIRDRLSPYPGSDELIARTRVLLPRPNMWVFLVGSLESLWPGARVPAPHLDPRGPGSH